MASMPAYVLRVSPEALGVWKVAATGMGSLMPVTGTRTLAWCAVHCQCCPYGGWAGKAIKQHGRTCGLNQQAVKFVLCSQHCDLLLIRKTTALMYTSLAPCARSFSC